jgi:hypothetical protein
MACRGTTLLYFTSLLYGCENWSLALREDSELRIICGTKRKEATEGWGRLYIEELSPYNNRLILDFKSPPRIFLFLTKIIPLKVINCLKKNLHTKCHVPTLTGVCFTSISEVRASAIYVLLKLRV